MTWTHDWEADSGIYSESLSNSYHQHRLSVIHTLIPNSLRQNGKIIFDFGCGEGVFVRDFLHYGSDISGCDFSGEMVALGKKNFVAEGLSPDRITQGGIDLLKNIDKKSLDGLFCFNVLAYVSKDEEKIFYEEAKNIVKPGGFLCVTHSNELFDMFSLNGYTFEFFKNHFISSEYHNDLAELLADKETKRPGRETDVVPQTFSFHVRENPLNYKYKLRSYGFTEIRQEFINHHSAPPALLKKDNYIDTVAWSEEQKWKLLFVCSSFASCAVRE